METLGGVTVSRWWGEVRQKKIPLLMAPGMAGLLSKPFTVVMERFDTFGGLGAVYARLKNLPLVLEVNYPHLEEMIWKWQQNGNPMARHMWLHRAMQRWNSWQFESAASIIATRRSIVPERFRDKVHLVHWGADTTHFKPAGRGSRQGRQIRTQLGIGDVPVVLAHGSFQPWHGVRMFPLIIKQVIARQKRVVFVFVGQGQALEEMKARLNRLGLMAHCRFVGLVDHRDIPNYLNAADIGLAPFTAAEYLPLIQFGFYWSPAKIFEYMASGLPIVTGDQDYLRTVVQDEGAGRCVRENDPVAFAQAILDILNDGARSAAMGRAGIRAVLQKYSWQAHVRQLDALIKALASKE